MVAPKHEYVLDFSNLCGGINLWDPDYRMKSNESPEMKNLLWRNGMLCSRKGQYRMCPYELGQGFAAYPRLWHGCIFAHIGANIFCFRPEEGEASPVLLATGIPKVRGTFFTYSDKLYYKTRGAYKEITATKVDGEWSFACNTVFPYEPVILINANPATGAGDLYQPENRMSSRKTVWYNAVDGAKTYVLPVKAERVTYVEVGGYHVTSGWSYDPQNGRVLFTVAPPVTDPPTNNTVRITYELDNPEAQKSIDDCRYAAVYGGTGELCVVMAGSEAQPNAYFWSGNSSIKMDASYFPMEQVQLAGASEERITGFGKQQGNLIVLKEGSVGKTALGVQEINGRVMIDMPYVPINATIGCDLPWSIQPVENNLVFANRKGIYMLLDTTAANENNIVSLSRKINGSAERPGYLADIINADEDMVCSCDDGTHYYLTVNGHTWAWNYELSGWNNPSWFLLTNTDAVALICEGQEIFHINGQGSLTGLHNEYNDYGEPIERLFRFPTMNFGSYDCRKNVNSVIVTLGAYEEENTELWYLTDYEERKDLTNLRVVGTGSRSQSAAGKPGTSRVRSRVAMLRDNSSATISDDYPSSEGEGGNDVSSVGASGESGSTPPVGTRPESTRVPAVFRRRPMCRRVLHFTMKLKNENVNEGFALIGAQVFYNEQGRLR